ncbi:MarR family transcriptional regulator [Paenibacillus spongiae]|uniref:MarR family transcriptional regulator n=2 Tax=Paenibacillus spongiae TaxID=2909671 RepID=A0ABY5SJV8_9BACL|nr:MarR family transcriptional regulator [Paenibacillus spongiae]UVI33725.1 MarR family transcriptional regulator [Paenibacillus spongiae]
MMGHIMKLHRHNVHIVIQDDVYPGQPPLLTRLLEHDGLSQKELAMKMNVKPATLTVMINRMAKNGLVERRSDPADQRVSRVYLTESGRKAAVDVKEAVERLEERSFSRFSEEEKAVFRHMLQRIHEEQEAFRRENS